jgi:two-component system cell cycle response regulator DivK
MTAPGPRILIVDDNITNLKLVSFLLADFGYDLRAAVSGEEALALVHSFRPRLVLLDLQMPETDSLELARRLKAEPATRSILVVAVTEQAVNRDDDKVRALGVDGYITKPLQPQQFRQALATFLTG